VGGPTTRLAFLATWKRQAGNAERCFQSLADAGRICVDGDGRWISRDGFALKREECAAVLVNELLPLRNLRIDDDVAILFPIKELGSLCLSLSIHDLDSLHPSQRLSCIAAVVLRKEFLPGPSIVNDRTLRCIGKKIVSLLDLP